MNQSVDTFTYTPDPMSSWTHSYSVMIRDAYESALAEKDTLSMVWKNMPGMSGRMYRAFINNLVKLVPDPRYLEIGTWKGSTACAAISGNKLKAVCVDNWSQFGGPKEEFLAHINLCLKDSDCDFNFIENDFRKVDYDSLGKFNIYFFDGPHEEVDQYDAIKYAQNALDDTYILVVDDFNVPHIRTGTYNALKDLNHNIVSSIEIISAYPGPREQHSHWHGGYFIAVIKKS